MKNYKSYEYNKEYIKNYHSKLVKPTIRMTEEEHQTIARAAELAGKSFNRYIIE